MTPSPNPELMPNREEGSVAVVRGRQDILALAPLLEEVAERLGEPGSMHWLEYFLSGPAARFKSPWLVLLMHPGAVLRSVQPTAVAGCALFAEYCVGGLRSRIFTTEDASGYRSVLAAPGQHDEVARRCSAELLRHGAHLVLANYAWHAMPGMPRVAKAALWATRSRTIGRDLELQPTMEATLARFSRTHRFRLGYFRRRLLASTPCTFVSDATAEMTEADFLAVNRDSLNVVSDEEAVQRWRACRYRGGYALGLRTDAGEWLGVIGGWRQGETTVLHWQANRTGWEKHSLSTVLRSYFLEHEIARGARRILFFGGTPHSMRHYFTPLTITDLLLRRRSVYAAVVMEIARRLAAGKGRLHRRNFLADALCDPVLEWKACAAQEQHAPGSAQPYREERRIVAYPVLVERRARTR